ncbi:MAG: translation initiation factor IF-2 N-terminal domain-containing protein, partial [Clostridiales bacterium]|nr:translation initiation factor IF-2 N-terminal domain-containing protein [Clostridiales bacterium]
MAKMRVHEFAKELNIKSQEIIDILSGTDYAVKSASSNIDDAGQELVRKKKGGSKEEAPRADVPKPEPQKSEAKPEAQKSEKPKADAPKNDAKKQGGPRNDGQRQKEGAPRKDGDRPKKKSSISAVFNAQYSRQSRKGGQGGGRGGFRHDGNRPEPQHSIIKPRPVGERALRPISERTAGNDDEFAPTNQPAQESPKAAESRPQGERRPQGDRQRPQGERQGERPRQQGDRQGGEHRNRPAGAGERRPQGERQRPQGDRSGQSRGQGGGRFGGRPAAAAPSGGDNRGKDSRSAGRGPAKRGQDRDKLGKRQENYINLEKHGGRKHSQPQPRPKEDPDTIHTITIPEKLTIRELAEAMKQQPSAVVKKLFLKGQMVTVNQEVDFDAAEEIALEFNYICEQEEKVDVIAELLKEDEEDTAEMVARPPVVCVMGHVDHGKTSLLDAIRSTKVTDKEAGGITQHIGASVVSINGRDITFLDTPGHEAFTAMRMRGANSTDIAVLVVAADDGVMPQTIEAINHAKAAGVEIIVAINKIDKPSANIEKVKQELSEYELIPEDWGGSTIFCPVSAHTKEGIDNLLEMILLTADVLELKANPNRNARGLVIEAQLDKGRGAVATVLVQKGTLHV